MEAVADSEEDPAVVADTVEDLKVDPRANLRKSTKRSTRRRRRRRRRSTAQLYTNTDTLFQISTTKIINPNTRSPINTD